MNQNADVKIESHREVSQIGNCILFHSLHNVHERRERVSVSTAGASCTSALLYFACHLFET